MTYLRRFVALVVVTGALSLSDAGGQTCGMDPGEAHTGPCSTQITNDDESVNPGQTSTPPAADSVDIIYVAEAAPTGLLIF